MFYKTNRQFTDVERNLTFDLYMNQDTHEYKLVFNNPKNDNEPAKGTEVNGFYISAHSGVTIKINSKKVIKLNIGQFYNLKEGEKVTHKKFTGFSKFTKC